mgnify:CR=1 FL=1
MKDKLRQLIKEAIEEGIFEVMCLLTVERQYNLTNILTDIRAIKGVTVVTLREAATFVSEDKEIAPLKIKIKPVGSSVLNYVRALHRAIVSLDGVISFDYKKIIDVEKRTAMKSNRKALKKDS